MSNYYLADGNFVIEDYLCHYGVRGMKWGIRRYQNPDGSLTSEGRKKAKTEYKRDSKTAFELGKNATLYGHATAKSMNRTIKIENKLAKQYEKDPDGLSRKTQKLRRKWDASSKTSVELLQKYNENKDLAEKHCQSLIDKYGKEAVRPINYKDIGLKKGQHSPSTFKTINEETTSIFESTASGVATVAGSVALSLLMECPVALLSMPATTGQRASRIEQDVYRKNKSMT